VEFFFENRRLQGLLDEPIAAALVAGGVKVFRVTDKMHRPRSFFCAVGKCSSCLMEVNGRPNVMVCVEPLKAGMRVKRQVGRGKLGQDSPQRHDGHNGPNPEATDARERQRREAVRPEGRRQFGLDSPQRHDSNNGTNPKAISSHGRPSRGIGRPTGRG
jgi:hypothetical protein